MELSDNAKKLCALFRDVLTEDEFIGTMLFLKTEENYAATVKWLEENPDAERDEIYDFTDSLLGI